MPIIKTEGVILRVMNYLETSKLITCYTLNQGKVSLLAKGARRAKSRFGGALDLMQHVSLVYYSKETRELQTLSQVEVIHSFQHLYPDLHRLSLGLAILELIAKAETEKGANPKLFRELLASLGSLERAVQPELIFYQFIWLWLANSGFRPKLRHCLSCGQPLKRERVSFSIKNGGYYCSYCRSKIEKGLDISEKCVKLLLYFYDESAAKIAEIRIPARLHSEIRQLSREYLQYYAEGLKKLKALDFLKRIENGNLELKKGEL